MRNSLIAGTALIGVGLLGMSQAHAQAGNVSPEPTLTTDSFNSGLASGATLAPGTVTVRLRAELWTELSYGQDSGTKTANGKESGVLLGSFARLYPKFDARAANGLEYGATMEVRMNSGGTSGTTGNTLYFRRYNGYVGTPTIGRLYVGPENMATARLQAGTTMEDFDYNGGFNGDIPAALNSGVLPNYAFLNQSTTYGSNNIVYISPAYAGFTFGASWEPSQSTGEAGLTSGSTLNSTSSSVAGSLIPSNGLRRNTVDAGIQYKGSFGPVALKAFGSYITSGKVNDATAVTDGLSQFKGWSIVATGARVTYGPASVGFELNTGTEDANGGGSLLRQGQRNGLNVVAGAQYIIGSLIFGAQYINENTGGFYNSNPAYTRSMLHETGVVVGGAWDYAPGSTLYADVLYDQRHQYGYGFVSGTNNTNVGNSVQGRAIQIGNTWKW